MFCNDCKEEFFKLRKKANSAIYDIKNLLTDPFELFIEYDTKLSNFIKQHPKDFYLYDEYLFLQRLQSEACHRFALWNSNARGYFQNEDGKWIKRGDTSENNHKTKDSEDKLGDVAKQKIDDFFRNLFRKKIKHIEKVVVVENKYHYSDKDMCDLNVLLAKGYHVKSVSLYEGSNNCVTTVFVLTTKDI